MAILVARPKSKKMPVKTTSKSYSLRINRKSLFALIGIIIALFCTGVVISQAIKLVDYSGQFLNNQRGSSSISAKGIWNDVVRRAQKELFKRLPSLPPINK